MSDALPRVTAYQRAHPGPLVGYAYLLWLSRQWRAFHAAQRATGGHGWADHHDCQDCRHANQTGEFDAWVLDGRAA